MAKLDGDVSVWGDLVAFVILVGGIIWLVQRAWAYAERRQRGAVGASDRRATTRIARFGGDGAWLTQDVLADLGGAIPTTAWRSGPPQLIDVAGRKVLYGLSSEQCNDLRLHMEQRYEAALPPPPPAALKEVTQGVLRSWLAWLLFWRRGTRWVTPARA